MADNRKPASDGADGNALDDYARTISSLVHDLRTPLTSIIGAASSLDTYADQFDDDTRTRLLRSIVEEADHLDRLLSNLSLLTKSRSGALTPSLRRVAIADVINGAIEKTRDRHETADIALSEQAAAPSIMADPQMLENALLNVFDIAIRFAPTNFATRIGVERESGRVTIAFGSQVAPASRDRLGKLLTAFADGRHSAAGRAGDFILLDAAKEVVQIHGGCFLAEATGEREQFEVALHLPT